MKSFYSDPFVTSTSVFMVSSIIKQRRISWPTRGKTLPPAKIAAFVLCTRLTRIPRGAFRSTQPLLIISNVLNVANLLGRKCCRLLGEGEKRETERVGMSIYSSSSSHSRDSIPHHPTNKLPIQTTNPIYQPLYQPTNQPINFQSQNAVHHHRHSPLLGRHGLRRRRGRPPKRRQCCPRPGLR